MLAGRQNSVSLQIVKWPPPCQRRPAIGFSTRQGDGDEKARMQGQSSDMRKGEVESAA